MRRGEVDGTARGEAPPSRRSRDRSRGREAPSRDGRRLAVGVAFMALLLLVALAAAFLLGRPAEGAVIAPGVPLLVLGGWVLIVGAAVVFYRTYPGGGGAGDGTPSVREPGAGGGTA